MIGGLAVNDKRLNHAAMIAIRITIKIRDAGLHDGEIYTFYRSIGEGKKGAR